MNEILTITVSKRVRYRIRNPGGRIGKRLATGKPYEHKLLDEIRRRKLKGSALDLGAHVGGHTLYLALMCGLKVHAWEANEDRYQQLVENMQLNPKTRGKVLTYPYAAGRASGWGSWKQGRYMSLEVGEGPVKVKSVDRTVDIPDLALVKIDIEGMEPDALAGMRRHLRRSHPVVYSEVHSQEAHDAQAKILQPLGYVMASPVVMGSRMECWVWRG